MFISWLWLFPPLFQWVLLHSRPRHHCLARSEPTGLLHTGAAVPCNHCDWASRWCCIRIWHIIFKTLGSTTKNGILLPRAKHHVAIHRTSDHLDFRKRRQGTSSARGRSPPAPRRQCRNNQSSAWRPCHFLASTPHSNHLAPTRARSYPPSKPGF